MNKKNGLLIVVSGASGSGKDSVVAELLKLRDDCRKTVSATSRPVRGSEKDGVDYYFFTRERFLEMIDEGLFVETNEYNGNFYGTLKSEIDSKLADGFNVILVIDINGAAAIKRLYPDSLIVFNDVPSLEELERRLRGRGTESEEAIRRRLCVAAVERARKDEFDRVIINDDLSATARELDRIINEKLEG